MNIINQHKRKMVFCHIFLLITSLVFSSNVAGKISGKQIMQKAYDRNDGDNSKTISEMILQDAKGHKRIRKVTGYTKDFGTRIKTLTRFTSPADIAGTGFLNWDNQDKADDQFLYLPAMKRVRRIVSTQKHNRFVNTDMTYEDMERREVNRDHHQFLGTVKSKQHKNITLYVVKSTSKKGVDSQYGYIKCWVAKELDYLVLKIHFYNKKGKHIKTMNVSSLKKVDNIWTAMKISLVDYRRKHKTIVSIKQIEYNRGIPNSYFTKNALKSY